MISSAVVGIDGHDGGWDALALAQRIAPDAKLTLVHAYGTLALPPGYVTYSDARTDIARAASDMLQRAVAERAPGADGLALPYGAVGFALHHAATQCEADLIVIGGAHHGPIGRVIAGDDVRATVHGARCGVAVAPRGYATHGAEIENVLAGFNGTPESRAALEVAAGISRRLKAWLRVISVAEEPGRVLTNYAYALDWPALIEANRKRAQALVDDAVRELENAEGEACLGDPAEELERVAGPSDLLVVGSRGWGPVRRVLLGSTSDRIVHDAPCPVVVVPRPTDREHASP